jgi:hypothetical protein
MERTKQKYVYVLVSKKSGRIILNCAVLPIYWLKEVADQDQKHFLNTGVVKRINLTKLEKLIEDGK